MESKTIMNWILTGSMAMCALMCFAGPFLWIIATNGGGHVTMVDSKAISDFCDDSKGPINTMAAFAFILFLIAVGGVVVQALITLEKLRFGIVSTALSGVCSLLSMVLFAMIVHFFLSTQCGIKMSEVASYGSSLGMYIMFWFVYAFFAVANFFVNGIKGE